MRILENAEARDVLRRAVRAARPTRGSMCWEMSPDCAYYHDAGMESDGEQEYGDDEGGSSGYSFDVTEAERIAFGYEPDVRYAILHYSSEGGAPDLETATEAEMAEYRDRLESERTESDADEA